MLASHHWERAYGVDPFVATNVQYRTWLGQQRLIGADAFTIDGDNRRAVPGIVRSMGSSNGVPSIPRGMLISSSSFAYLHR